MGKSLVILLVLFLQGLGLATNQDKPMLLKNATLHLGNGQSVESASIILDRGTFLILETDAAIQDENYTIIDLSGLHIYPFEILEQNESKAFILEFENLISLHSAKDSTLTARVFHNQLPENFFLMQGAFINFVVLTREWKEKRERTIRYVFYKGEWMPRSL